ncbi:ribosome hibernation-promoting factor, HPF/YfiA family [Williamsia deligens]|uniref:Ribosome hibernation promoting factor n=1 Tax=Williamsia deligens TaxID=321325 RepID=A0ABW3G1S6_9NOCA|nr:ribosome-associated translation inhibitor RaiA [Williamsia deligens]MCP2194796.1 ribosomal subunit interface protein [Williamsia deligens]
MSTTTHVTPSAEADAFDRRSAFVADGDTTPAQPTAELIVTGRNVEIPDHFRVHVGDKLARVERFDPSIYAFDVELHHERNRRQSKACQRVEITARGRGPVVRAEACGRNFYAALEEAVDKMQSRLRRTKDRRRVHHGLRTPTSVAAATAELPPPLDGTEQPAWAADLPEPDEPGRIVRVKDHPAVPMTTDDALYEMELVGHDFFLFHDAETDQPSVVYRRHAFDYGLIRLTPAARG